ncbi:MAG TPA: PQQ-binding-like beta-propeller repeat protein [Thermoleophilaceae bacterium]|jgi:outer membrane protein assembly factor BamB
MRTVRIAFRGLAPTLLVAASLLAGQASAAKPAAGPCNETRDGGEWPSYGHDVANTRTQSVTQGIGPDAVGNLKPAWSFDAFNNNDQSGFSSTPIVYGGCVHAATADGWIYTLDVDDGHLVWQRKLDVPHPASGGAIVGTGAVYGNWIIWVVDEEGGPYAIALNRSTGETAWQSQPWVTAPGNVWMNSYFSHASPLVANGLVTVGYSAAEGDSHAVGGFAIMDVRNGAILKVTPTIPPADQARGYAGGGLWSTAAYDPGTKYAYWGAGNPFSKQIEHEYTNAIIKVDLDRKRPTFGQIVASYKGNVDQYSEALQEASHTPACAASDVPATTNPFDDPVCGQLDLDFGASANLFTTSDGQKLVGDLQKSGVYHVAHADTMKPAWTQLVGTSCGLCNFASAAFDGNSVDVASTMTEAGTMFSLGRDDGAIRWTAPIGDAAHFQSVSTADGVVWTVDATANLVGWDAASGREIARRSMTADAAAPTVNGANAGGVAIAEHTIFAAAGRLYFSPWPGLLVAYRPG